MPLSGIYQPGRYEWSRKQAEDYEASNGADAADLQGRPIVVLTTLGARSGALRKTALMRVEHDGRYVVVASKGGAPDNPAWYWNIRKHPEVELQDGADRRDYRARELSGPERDEWWARACEAWPPYAEYQTKTDRLIPLFLLEPIAAG